MTSITIPSNVSGIGMAAFSGCTSLNSVTIENGNLTTIELNAFGDCTSLTSINIPNSVKYIQDGAFIGCNKLKSITIPPSVTEIGEAAIGYSSDTNRIPDFVIYGQKSSVAETYALENAITFKATSESPVQPSTSTVLGDVDGNGVTNAIDASYILQYAAYVGVGYKGDMQAFMEYIRNK